MEGERCPSHGCWPPPCAFRTQPGLPAPFNPHLPLQQATGIGALHPGPSLPVAWAAPNPSTDSSEAQVHTGLRLRLYLPRGRWLSELQACTGHSWGQLGALLRGLQPAPLPTPSRERLSSPWGDGAREVWLTLEPQTSCLKSRNIIVHQNLLRGAKREAGLHPEEQKEPPLTECSKFAGHASPCSSHTVSFKPDGNLVRHELLLFPYRR